MIIGKSRTNQPVESSKELDGELEQMQEDISNISSLIPPIESGDAGKVIVVNEDEDGYELGTPSGGTKLYKHVINLGGYGNSLICITNSEDEITDLTNAILSKIVSYCGLSTSSISPSGSGNVVYSTYDTTNVYFIAVYGSGSPSSATYTIQKISVARSATISDTVTPL